MGKSVKPLYFTYGQTIKDFYVAVSVLLKRYILLLKKAVYNGYHIAQMQALLGKQYGRRYMERKDIWGMVPAPLLFKLLFVDGACISPL